MPTQRFPLPALPGGAPPAPASPPQGSLWAGPHKNPASDSTGCGSRGSLGRTAFFMSQVGTGLERHSEWSQVPRGRWGNAEARALSPTYRPRAFSTTPCCSCFNCAHYNSLLCRGPTWSLSWVSLGLAFPDGGWPLGGLLPLLTESQPRASNWKLACAPASGAKHSCLIGEPLRLGGPHGPGPSSLSLAPEMIGEDGGPSPHPRRAPGGQEAAA